MRRRRAAARLIAERNDAGQPTQRLVDQRDRGVAESRGLNGRLASVHLLLVLAAGGADAFERLAARLRLGLAAEVAEADDADQLAR